MWEQADFVDMATGNVDSIPEEEYSDYVGACLMAFWDEGISEVRNGIIADTRASK